ncbi:MAG: nickel-responsive transcriptional regulator NikR [Actinomycetota bacterium]
MAKTVRFGVAMDDDLLWKFDRVVDRKGYENRSEAIRDLIRNLLVEEEWAAGDEETVGTITLVYDHHVHDLQDTLTDLQHNLHEDIISSVHVHLDAHNCLEVLIVKGKSGDIKAAADRLIGTKGVKHGRLTMTTTGKELV